MVHEGRQEKEDASNSCFPPEFRTTAAYAVHFPGIERRSPTLVDPCNGSVQEIPSHGIIDTMRGKRCLACAGTNWFLVLDEATWECFFTTLFAMPPPPTTTVVLPLPPMPPEDPTQLDFLFNCALSAPDPTAPGCIIVLGFMGETYLRYCRLGDDAWSRVEVTFQSRFDVLSGAVACHGGRIYATTNSTYSVVFDATAPAPEAPRVERTDIKIPAPPLPGLHPGRPYLVAPIDGGGGGGGGGELYFVRPYFFGFPEEVVAVGVCRWDPSRDAWTQVDGIGDMTLFVGSNSLAVPSSPATETETEPNTIHILWSRRDGVRVFTFSLNDMTIRCTFVGTEDGDDEEEDSDEYDDTSPPPETQAFWSLPRNGRFKFELPRQQGGISKGDGQEKGISRPGPTSSSECPPKWCRLPTDLLAEHVVPKLSFIDFLRLKSVCKDWSAISTPVRDTKTWPLLVTPAPPGSRINGGSSLDVFDPVTKNKYTLSVRVPGVTDPDYSTSLMLHCSKNGWLLVSRGHDSFFLVNPLKRGNDAVVALPPTHNLHFFKGISFCSTPGSHGFMVMILEGFSYPLHGDTVSVRTWRPGQASWEQLEEFDCEVPFVLATHNPLFLDGEFYCLARDGKLGAFDPKTMAWRVLDGLEPIVSESFATGEEGLSAFLVEWKGEVVVVLRWTNVEEPIDIFQLDRGRMAWSKLEELGDGAVFWDRKQATLRPSWSLAQGFSTNKVYEPTFSETEDGVRECIFYSLDKKEYSNGSYSLYGLREPINSLWFEPNLDDYESS